MKSTSSLRYIYAAFWSLALLCGAQKAAAHGVQIGYGVLSNGYIRVYVEDWHGDHPGLSNSPLSVTTTTASGTSTATYNAKGEVPNTAWNNLPGLGSSITILQKCSGQANTYNDWLYWDFAPGSCNQPVSITINAGLTAVTTEACTNLYPVTITGQVFTDQGAPVITAPDVTVVGDCNGANVSFAPTAIDDCDKNPVITISHASGSYFPVGVTTVTITATDNTGKTAAHTFNVTVVAGDSIAPTLTVPAPITVNNEAGKCGAAVSFSATATDNCSTPTVVSTPASGSFFAVGTTVVTSVATDAKGNRTTKTFTVTVKDTQRPVITAPASILATAPAGSCNAAVSFAATASDNCSGVAISYSPASGSTFARGVTVVTATATDASGNTASTTFTVTVRETQPPTITNQAANKGVESDGAGNPAALSAWLASNGGATATDACGAVTWSNNYSALSVGCGKTGAATVVFTATDTSGNSSSTTATFTISDTTAPAIAPAAANATVESDGAGNTAALGAWLASNGGASATDTGGTVTWSNNYSALSAGCGKTGAATVIFTATDACGNKSSTTATFKISDTIKPVIVAPAANKLVESDGAGNTAALGAWLAAKGGASATDIGSAVTWSNNFTAVSDGCGSTGAATVTFTATDECGNASSTTATFTITDTIKPVLSSNVRIISPNEKPVTFTFTSADVGGGSTPSILSVTATRVNGSGKTLDKTDPYKHTVSGNTVTIVTSGGVGTVWTINVSSVDECGNTATGAFVVNVVNPTLTK